jgi:hypothetical protein
MAKFMLLFHETPGKGLQTIAPAEAQQVLQKIQDWFSEIRASEKYVASDKLREEGGKMLSKQNGRITSGSRPAVFLMTCRRRSSSSS